MTRFVTDFDYDPIQKPIVTVGGVPLEEQNFKWALTSGPLPYVGSFIVRKGDRNNAIKSLVNPVNMRIAVQVGTRSATNSQVQDILFQNLYLHEPHEIDEFHVMWKIADIRWTWRGKKEYFAYNVTRLRNQLVSSVNNVPQTDPAILRAPFDVFKTGRYLRDSAKADGSPFSMAEILLIELAGLGIINPQIDVLSREKSYVLENIEANGDESYTAIANLLAASRMNIGIRPDGSLFVYSIDFFDKTSIEQVVQIQNQAKIRPGTVYKQELSRVRPKKIRVRFEKKHEVIFKDSRATEKPFSNPPVRAEQSSEISYGTGPLVGVIAGFFAGKIQSRTILPCVNVIQVPFSPANSSFFYQIGEYVPLLNYVSEFDFTEKDLRELWWTNCLEFELSKRLQGGQIQSAQLEPLAFSIVAAIRNSYRQLYMIDPFYLDKLETIEDTRCAIIDNYSAYRPPAPVWSDYAIVPRIRNIEIARNRALSQDTIKNWIVNEQDPFREKATAGRVVLINPDLGVFRIEYPRDVDTVVAQIIPSAIDNPPTAAANANVGLARFLLSSQSPLAKNFTMEAMMSVTWKFDPVTGEVDTEKRYYDVNFDYTDNVLGPALGPDIDFLCRKEFARIDLDNVIVNEQILRHIAESEAGKIFNQFIDRFVGYVTIPGIYKEINLIGNIKAIYYKLNASDGMTTEIDMMEIPFAPTLEQSLPPSARRYLFKQLDRGGP